MADLPVFKKRQCLSVYQATADDDFRLKSLGINLPYIPFLEFCALPGNRNSGAWAHRRECIRGAGL